MLDSLRKRQNNFIYTALLLAVAAVMAFVGVNQMDGQEPGGADGAAAWVNGELISKREFQMELSYRMDQYQAMLGGQYDEKLLAALQIPQRTMEELVQY